MAYYDYDRGAAIAEVKRKAAYEALKEKLSEQNYDAFRYILDMEQEMKTMEKQLEKYRKFFEMLKELTPKGFDTNTPLR